MTWFALRIAAICTVLASLPGAAPALAHHSGAMFDWSHLTTLDGTVKEFDWTNPHVVLWVYTNPQPGAQPDLWTLEFTSPGNLSRLGMSRHSFKPGDHVQALVAPARDGTHSSAFQKITLVDANPVVTFAKDGGGATTTPDAGTTN